MSFTHQSLMTIQWCSICEDFGTLLVLCSRCRVSICVKSQETSVGCAKWDPIIEDPTFIYICPWCATQSTGLSMVCAMKPGNI